MECQCEKYNLEDAATAGWLNSNSVQMGAFTVVGYLLYRFSQTLPALIRWPIRIFCSLTGLSALWSWVSRLVGTLCGIQSLFKWLSRIWHFFVGISSRFKWVGAVIQAITGSESTSSSSSSSQKPGLRLILLGPTGGGRTSLADTLLGKSGTTAPTCPLTESTERRTVMDGQDLTVIDTPDLLGASLGSNMRAREALRSLQLAGPGPHAFLLVLRAPGSGKVPDQDANQAIQAVLELFGEEVMGHIIPVLTHADRLSRKNTVDHLLKVDTGTLRRAVSLCGQKPALVDNRPNLPSEAQSVMQRNLVGRVMEVKELRGHFVHELQRREDRIREELLADMASALATKLGHS